MTQQKTLHLKEELDTEKQYLYQFLQKDYDFKYLTPKNLTQNAKLAQMKMKLLKCLIKC